MAKKDMTSTELADQFYAGVKNEDPQYDSVRSKFQELKKTHPGGLKDRDLASELMKDGAFSGMVNITDLTPPPPGAPGKGNAETPKALRGAQKIMDAVKNDATLSKVVSAVIPGGAVALATGKHPFTPITETMFGPGKTLEGGVRSVTDSERGKKVLASLPGPVSKGIQFGNEMVAQTAGVVDSLQTPVGLAASLLGGPILGKVGQWSPKLATTLSRLAGTTMTGVMGAKALGDVADFSDHPDPKNLARLVTDAGLALTPVAAELIGKFAPKVAPTAKTPPPPGAKAPSSTPISTVRPGDRSHAVPEEVFRGWRNVRFEKDPQSGLWKDRKSPNALHTDESVRLEHEKVIGKDPTAGNPPGEAATTHKLLPPSSDPNIELWGKMPMQDLLTMRNALEKAIPAMYAETSPYTTKSGISQADVARTKNLDYINKIIASKGGPPPATKSQAVSKTPLDLSNAPKHSTDLTVVPRGTTAPPPGAQRQALPAPGESGLGSKTADTPHGINNTQASTLAQKHGVHADLLMNASRQPNSALVEAINKLTAIRSKIKAPGGTSMQGVPEEEITRHIDALTELLLNRDKPK